jgi:hypothetical protein
VSISRAADCTGGGQYSPSAPLIINGSGLSTTTVLNCTNTSVVTLAGSTSIANATAITVQSGGTLTCAAGSTTILNDPGLLGTTSAVNIIAVGTLDVTGATTLGAVDINGTTTLDGATTVTGTTALNGVTTATDLTMTGTTKLKLASRSITRVQSSQAVTDDDGSWVLDNASGKLLQIADDSIARVVSPLRVPHGSTLTAVSMSIAPAVGHAGLPSTKLGSLPDPSTTVLEYEATHPVPISLSTVIDRTTKRYFAALSGEADTNFLVNLLYIATKATYTTTAYDED